MLEFFVMSGQTEWTGKIYVVDNGLVIVLSGGKSISFKKTWNYIPEGEGSSDKGGSESLAGCS